MPEHYLSRLSPLERSMSESRNESGVAAPCALLVPRGYAFKEGTPLWNGVVLGRFLGAGVQVLGCAPGGTACGIVSNVVKIHECASIPRPC